MRVDMWPDKTIILSHLRHLCVTGEDSATFLQRQLSCDVTRVAVGGCIYGTWCNAKGRVIADLLVARDDQAFYLIVHRSQIETLLPGLQRYVLRDRVKLEAPTDTVISGCGVGDPGRANATMGWLLPWDHQRAITLQATSEVAFNNAETANVTDNNALSQWQTLDIRAGVPWLPDRLSGQFLPQMLGLEALNAISYDKGCYPGQEVVARTHYLGGVKRHAMQLTLNATDSAPVLGSLIYNHKDEDAGVLVAISESNSEWAGLGVIQQGHQDQPLHLKINAQPTPLILEERAT